ncbi:hypothetical protein BH20ACI4_BH20ACI4_01720 [soil metagenome]
MKVRTICAYGMAELLSFKLLRIIYNDKPSATADGSDTARNFQRRENKWKNKWMQW